MTLLTNKEVADEMRCSVETMLYRAKLLKIKPTFSGHSGHRWERELTDSFFKRWSAYSQNALTKTTRGTRKPVPVKIESSRRAGDGAGNRR